MHRPRLRHCPRGPLFPSSQRQLFQADDGSDIVRRAMQRALHHTGTLRYVSNRPSLLPWIHVQICFTSVVLKGIACELSPKGQYHRPAP